MAEGPRERRRRTAIRAAALKDAQGLVGQLVLDRYYVEAMLGEGAMGTVFRGRHVKLSRDVAIKVMHEHLENDSAPVQRFHREAIVAGKLHHPNCVPVIDVGDHAGKPVMVMEYAAGPSLTALVAQEFPQPPARIAQLVRGILDGLDHAHGLGLVHRDLKPDNVIVEGNTTPRIVDFGIAFLQDPDASADGGRLTASGIIVGTPQYMAPEQARGGAIDHRVDLFSLGMILYEMIAGKPAFTGTPIEVAVANMSRDVPPIAGADPRLSWLMKRLLDREVDTRIPSARAARNALDLDVARALATISLG